MIFKNAVRKAKGDSWRLFTESMNSHCATARLAKIMRRNETLRISNVLRPNGEFTESSVETINCLLDTLAPGSREVNYSKATEEPNDNSAVLLEKMERAINEFLPIKTPGPDGIYAVLLQKGWNSKKHIPNHVPNALEVQLCAESMEGRDWYFHP